MRDRRPLIVGAAVVALVVAVVVAVGMANPPRKGVLLSDRLGPEQGEQVAAYVERAAGSLGKADGDRYALVSLTAELTPADAARLADGVRVSQVSYRVPMPRVQTPLVTVGVGAGSEALIRSAGYAAGQVGAASTDRGARINAVSASRIGSGCACVVALTVRAGTDRLIELEARPRVRAVEALPVDAVFGRFAVAPLLPEQVDVVEPGPDDGEILPN